MSEPQCALGTDLGRALEPVAAVRGVIGVVLSDEHGDAIDYVHDGARLSALDVQILGAQLGLPLARATTTATILGMRDVFAALHGRDRTLLCAMVGGPYVLAAMLARPADVVRAQACMQQAHGVLTRLLR